MTDTAQRRRIWLATATAALVTGGLAAAYPALAGPATHPDQGGSPEMLAAMQRDLGLDADGARARIGQQNAAHQVAAALGRDLAAGSWFDAGTGKLNVAVTDRAAADQVRAAGAEPALVGHGPAELRGITQLIGRLAGGGVPGVTTWHADARTDTVVITVDSGRGTAATTEFLARARALSGAVQVEEKAGVPHQQAGGTVVGGNPWWPGTESNCSVAFAATDANGGRHFVTAGHCTNDANQAAYGNDSAGTKTQLGTSNVGGNHSVNAQEGDFGLVDVTTAGWTLSSSVNTWGGAAVNVTGVADAIVGDAICHSGNTSHWQCGTVTKINESVDYGNGLIIDGLSETNACSAGGDSGGSYVLPGTGTNNKAVGIHSGGGAACGQSNPDTIFQPVSEPLTKWGLTLYTGTPTSPTTGPTTQPSPTVKPSPTVGPTTPPTTPPAGRTFSSNATMFIPDPGTVNSSVTSNASGSAAGSVKVVASLSHWCGEEVALVLVAPNGSQYPVKASGSGACANYSGGTYTVTGVNSPAAGTWTLRVTDTRAWNFGSLNSWSITL